MTAKEVYNIWAPVGAKWIDWVRPVAFVQMRQHSKNYNSSGYFVPVINCIGKGFEDAAVIVDMPGGSSVEWGIGLAGMGFRPIPIFNGTIEQVGARANVDNQSVGRALVWGAGKLFDMDIKDDALPAFLTDSNRMDRFKMEISLFDNSWDVYHQDLPSAEYLLNAGIRKIVVIGNKVSGDLKKIFLGYQKKGIVIYHTKGFERPVKIIIKKPIWAKW